MSANRVQRWAVVLSAYDFEIRYIKGVDNARADSLSRLPLTIKETQERESSKEEYSYLSYVTENMGIVDHNVVCEKTGLDPILRRIREFVISGWPENIDENLKMYKTKEKELTVENGCLMWGYRVIIPECLRKEILGELHSSHLGIVKMKSVARSYVWWPGINKEIENVTKACELCLETADNPPKATLHSWKWPDGPNIRLHADFLGPIEGKMFLVIIDAYSKWLDVKEMRNITTVTTIMALREYFCTWGIPISLVTDNGPSFCSSDFEKFLTEYGVRHIRTAPYHPASNGAAENAVRTFKKKYKIFIKEGSTCQEALCKFLFSYRATPHCTTEYSPAELQIGRKFRTKMDLLKPSLRSSIEKKQLSQQRCFRGNRKAEFEKNDIVMAKDTINNSWRKSSVIDRISPVTYVVNTSDGKVWKRHTDQIRECKLENQGGQKEQGVLDPVPSELKTDSKLFDSMESIGTTKSLENPNRMDHQMVIKFDDPPVLRRLSRVPKPRKIFDL